MASDLSVVSERFLQLLLYPVVGWAAVLLVFYGLGHLGWGLVLCFPLAAWLGALVLWWAFDTRRRFRSGEVERAELAAGVRTVGHVLAGAAATPALVFLADDPLAPSAWSTTVGVGIVAGVAYGAVSALVRWPRQLTLGLALLVAWASLPVNAMGAVTVATMLGWYDHVAERTPMPERRPPKRR